MLFDPLIVASVLISICSLLELISMVTVGIYFSNCTNYGSSNLETIGTYDAEDIDDESDSARSRLVTAKA